MSITVSVEKASEISVKNVVSSGAYLLQIMLDGTLTSKKVIVIK